MRRRSARGEIVKLNARKRLPPRLRVVDDDTPHDDAAGTTGAPAASCEVSRQSCCGNPRFRPPWLGSSHREVIAFSCVKKSKPRGP